MTIKEIAQLAGVSTATISRVINGSPIVSPDLRKKVEMIIKDTGYVPNMIGRNLRQACSMKILFTMAHADSPHSSTVLHGFENEAKIYGYDILTTIAYTVEDERRMIEMLSTKQVDGAVMCVPSMPIEEIEVLSQKYPVVLACIGFGGRPISVSYSAIDTRRAIFDAVTHCLNNGRKRIAFMRGFVDTSVDIVAHLGYQNALAQFGIEENLCYNIRGNVDYKGGEKICRGLMELPNPPDAIITISDLLAFGSLRYLVSSGIKPGEDVDVIGFHDSQLSEVFMPSLSSVFHPMEQIGKVAFDLLLEKIEDINSLPKTLILPHKLILRETTKQQVSVK